MTDRTRLLVLATGDAAAIASFAVIGLVSHNEGVTVAGVVRNAGPVLAGWAGAAALFRPYSRSGARRLLATWGVGVSGGVLLRATLLDRPLDTSYLTFWGVTMAATLALVGTWRAAARTLGPPASAAASWPR